MVIILKSKSYNQPSKHGLIKLQYSPIIKYYIAIKKRSKIRLTQ